MIFSRLLLPLGVVALTNAAKDDCKFKGWGNIINFEIEVQNVAPEGGTCQSPVWVGIHTGNFDLFAVGESSDELQAATRSGDASAVSPRFEASESAIRDVVIGDQPICPGESATKSFIVNMPKKGTTSYLSFLSTVLPCAGTFVGNDVSVAEVVYNQKGGFSFRPVTVPGTDVFRAGGSSPPLPQGAGGRSEGSSAVGRADGGCTVDDELTPPGARFDSLDFFVPDYDMMKISINRRKSVCAKAETGLKPKKVVPRIKKKDSPAKGVTTFRYFEDGVLFYAIQVGLLEDYTACTLNKGKRGRNGEVMIELVNNTTVPSISSAYRGVIEPSEGEPTKDEIWMAINDKEAYVVCTSERYPDGEVRGDLSL